MTERTAWNIREALKDGEHLETWLDAHISDVLRMFNAQYITTGYEVTLKGFKCHVWLNTKAKEITVTQGGISTQTAIPDGANEAITNLMSKPKYQLMMS